MIEVLAANALLFSTLAATGFDKISFIRKLPGSHWGVFSHKGKLLGKYPSRTQAEKRLRQIEYFKYHKASKEETYSSLTRSIKDKYSPEVLKEFRTIYKNTFDQALLDNETNPEDLSLQAVQQFLHELGDDTAIASLSLSLVKQADELGTPDAVGLYLSNLIRFIFRRISSLNRNKSINNIKRKILALDEYNIAVKKLPPAASIGQGLVIIKHLMFGKDPAYIRQVLNSIANHL